MHSGKDYSNPRIVDFHQLSKPDEDMYDRAKVPRMPWWAFSVLITIQYITTHESAQA